MPTPELLRNMTDDQIVDYLSRQFSSSFSSMDQAATWRDMAKAILDSRSASTMKTLTQRIEVLTWVLVVLTVVLVIIGIFSLLREKRIFRRKKSKQRNG